MLRLPKHQTFSGVIMNMFQKIIHEPLLHFLLIGAAIFLYYGAVAAPSDNTKPDKEIVVTTAQAEQLAALFQKSWRRPPTRAEMDALIETYIREEVLVQEALALSMEKNDAIIKRRLVQKMKFLIDSATGAKTPSEIELKNFFEKNRQNYATEPLIVFEQVFLGNSPDTQEISDALTQLSTGADPNNVGTRSLLPPIIGPAMPAYVDGTLGTGVFANLEGLELGKWNAPVVSGFGVHAVRIIDLQSAVVPELEAVRERVEADWKAEISESITENMLAQMRLTYEIKRPAEDDLAGFLE